MKDINLYINEKLHLNKDIEVNSIDLDDKEYIILIPAERIENKAFGDCLKVEHRMNDSNYITWILSLEDIENACKKDERVKKLYYLKFNKDYSDELIDVLNGKKELNTTKIDAHTNGNYVSKILRNR